MHSKIAVLALAVSVASSTYAQTPGAAMDRVYNLTNTQTPQQMNEIATVVRSVGDIRQVYAVVPQKVLTVHGTIGQIAVADWLVGALNRAAPESGTHEYHVPGSADDVVRVFYLNHARTPQETQKIVTAIRSLTEIQRIFIYNSLSAVAARGTAAQIAFAEWLVNELNQPAQTRQPGTHEHTMTGYTNQVARVFYLSNVDSTYELQQVVTAVRTTTEMQRIFINNARKAIAARGTAEQIASAERLISQLDRAR